jgi:hypothetical protein
VALPLLFVVVFAVGVVDCAWEAKLFVVVGDKGVVIYVLVAAGWLSMSEEFVER